VVSAFVPSERASQLEGKMGLVVVAAPEHLSIHILYLEAVGVVAAQQRLGCYCISEVARPLPE